VEGDKLKIAVVGPSPVPYVYGGAEGLMWKLTESINKLTSHQAELIKLPCKENSFWDLIDSYHKFYALDLSHFDMVISTKYPCWMVRHKNHVVYMQHHLRGLFDTYQFFSKPEMMPQNAITDGLIGDTLDLIREGDLSERIIDKVFDNLECIRNEKHYYEKSIFDFPGPFIREIVHFLDAYALSPERITRYTAISNNVKNRKDYFPHGAIIEAIHHPSKIEDYKSDCYEYFFTASRLDSPKRINILIEAMRYVPHDVKFKIVGTGPEEKELKELASNDSRVEFLGFVKEDQLINLYSKAIGVLYIPYDEDYGLITIEAMMSKKPVITATDSGGPLEFVNDGQTGCVAEPNPQKMAKKMNYLIENPKEAKKMGETARQRVETITWNRVISKLLGEIEVKTPTRMKILVLSTYSCYPPRGGGQHRLYNIYSRLAREFDVTILSIIEANKTYQNLILDNGLKQICVPQSIDHAQLQWKTERDLKANLYDVCMIDFVNKSRDYIEKAKDLINVSDVIIFSHPYLYGLSEFIDKDKIVVYEAHNVEYLLKKDYVKDTRWSDKVKDIENSASEGSDLIITTSEEDKKNITDLFNISPEKIFVAPNGVDISKIDFITEDERARQKEIAGLKGRPTVLFIGSWHPPNLEALRFIAELADKNDNYIFLIVGSIKDYYQNTYGELPKKVLAFGVVDEDEKYEIYKLADLAINPMFSGSGTNIKMLDYMSAGIPVISTSIGARGLGLENNKHALICSKEKFLEMMAELTNNQNLTIFLAKNARTLVEESFSWDKISKDIIDRLKGIRQ